MTVLETERLTLRHVELGDAAFILDLLNQPSFLQFIGDRGVRTLEDAERYIATNMLDSYERHGHGLYLALLRESGEPVGVCGLIKRDTLDDVDIGYALLPQFWSRGLACEAASAVLSHGRSVLGLGRIVAIVSPGNGASIRVLEKLGLQHEKRIRLADDAEELELFAISDTNPTAG